MLKQSALLLILLASLGLSSCYLVREGRRLEMRDRALGQRGSEFTHQQLIERNLRTLRGEEVRRTAPRYRWQAAQNLGAMRAMAAYDELYSTAFAAKGRALHPSIRRESVIALTKMPFSAPTDARRQRLLAKLANDLEERVNELAPSEQYVYIGAIVTLAKPQLIYPDTGGEANAPFRDAVFELLAIARRLSTIVSEEATIERIGLDDRVSGGIGDAAEEALIQLLAVNPKDVYARRSKIGAIDGITVEAYFSWWQDIANALPTLESYAASTSVESEDREPASTS